MVKGRHQGSFNNSQAIKISQIERALLHNVVCDFTINPLPANSGVLNIFTSFSAFSFLASPKSISFRLLLSTVVNMMFWGCRK